MIKCPICGREARIGQDGPTLPERPEEIVTKFAMGEISLAEFDAATKYYKTREFICPSRSIPELDGKPCPNFEKVIETAKLYV